MAEHQPTLPDDEQWRPIHGWQGLYEVSDHGRVRSLGRTVHRKDGVSYWKKPRVLKLNRLKSGHLSVGLTELNGKCTTLLVHRLVLEAFVGPCPEGMEACHWNDEPADNRVINLRWASRSENLYDRSRNGIDNNGTKYATHCRRGHEFSPENTITYKDGHRACRTCKSAAGRKRSAEARKMRPAKPPRTKCKRGHRLDEPNLRQGQLPRKDCKACHRAHAYASKNNQKHRLQEISDSYYEQIMS